MRRCTKNLSDIELADRFCLANNLLLWLQISPRNWPGAAARRMISLTFMYVLISIVLSIAFGLVSLNWFFRDGEDTDTSFQRFYESEFSGFGLYGTTKFGLWLTLSFLVGVASYHGLPLAWALLVSIYERIAA